MKNKINRFGVTGWLFMFGLAVSAFVMMNIADVLTRIRNEEAYLNRFKYSEIFTLYQQGSLDYKEYASLAPKVFSALEQVGCGVSIYQLPVNVEYQMATSNIELIMNPGEDLKFVSADNEPIPNDILASPNSVVVGHSVLDITENHEGKILNIKDNQIYVKAVLKDISPSKIDSSIYAIWDKCDDNFREYLTHQGTAMLRWGYFRVHFFGDSPIREEINKFSAAMNELGLDCMPQRSQGYKGKDGENTWYRIFNKILLPICMISGMFVCFSSSYFWVRSRKNEIAMRKAYGYSNPQVLGLIIKDELRLSFPAFAAAIIVQFVFCAATGSLDFFDAAFPLKLLFVYTGMAILTLLCAIRVSESVGKISPAAALKEV